MTRPAPSVALVVPSHNRAAAIAETLQSLVAQDRGLAGVEAFYLADDCSTDATVAVASRAWQGAVPLQVLQPPKNQGTYGNTNHVLESLGARYDWLLFLHDDDLARPDWLATMVNRMASCDASVATICTSWNVLETDGALVAGEQRNGQSDVVIHGGPDSARGTILKGCWWHFSGGAIRTAAVRAVGLFDPNLPQCSDWDWLVRCLLAGWDVLYVPESLIDYRQHGGTVSSRSFRVHRDLREQLVLVDRYRAVLTRGDLARMHWRVSGALARRTARAVLRGEPAAIGAAMVFLPTLLTSAARMTRSPRVVTDAPQG